MADFKNSWGVRRYVVGGNGPAVLLIHGVGSQLENWDGVASLRSMS